MGDFFKVIGASLGWVKDFSADLGILYLEFLKRAAWISAGIFLVGFVFLYLSETFGLRIFNALGMLLITGVPVFWVLASWPVVALGEQLTKIDAIRQITQRVGTSFLLVFLFTLFALIVPAGTSGITLVFISVLILFGAVLVGYRLTKRAIGVKMIMIGLLLAVVVYLPLSSSKIPAIQQVLDRSIINKIIPGTNELDISLSNLQGENSNAPKLFWGGDPLWWCRRAPERTEGFVCFDQSGRDQITNEELVPISQEIVAEMKYKLAAEGLRLDAEEAERAAELKEKERQARAKQALEETAAAKRAEKERLQAIETERNSYIRRYVSANNSSVDVGLSFLQGDSLNRHFSQQLGDALTVSYNPQVLTDLAVSDSVFDRLFSSDLSEIEKLRLNKVAGRLVLGKLDVVFKDNNVIRGAVNVTIALGVRILDTKTGAIVDSFQHEASALGHSQFEAQKIAETQLIQKVAKRITTD